MHIYIYVAIYMYIFGIIRMQINKRLDSGEKYLPFCYFSLFSTDLGNS